MVPVKPMKKAIEHAIVALVLTIVLVVAGCAVTRTIEDPPGSGNFKQVAETDPRFTKGLGTAEGVAGVFGPINPWHGIVTILLGGAAAVAEWNKRRKQAQLDAVIAGVEAADNVQVKKAINVAAMAAKVEPQLNESVKKVTGG